MNIFIEIYMLICVMMLLFDIVFLIIKNRSMSASHPRNTIFEKSLCRELEKYHKTGSFSESFIRHLPKKLSRCQNMISLITLVENNPEEKDLFRTYIFDQIDNYAKKSNYDQAYYTYVISTYSYEEKRVPPDFAAKVLDFLESTSLYTFINTMNALYAFGEDFLLLRSFDKIDERKGFYNKKLFVDGLLTAHVDFERFNKKILNHFEHYSPYLQDCLLDYFRLGAFDASDLCLSLIKNPQTDLQVQYTSMRYFAKYPNNEARELFLTILSNQEESWLKQMLAIQGLVNYNDFAVRSALKSKVTSSNWYVRVNAIKALHKIGMDRSDIAEILSLQDKYTTDALLYQYCNDESMSRYIADVIHSIEMQSAQTDEHDNNHSENVALTSTVVER